MARLDDVLSPTLAGMGYELVDVQASNRGRLLRIFIDKPGGITVDDCADVSRHLARVFEVEGIDYDRLEVSSPGLDRPLRGAGDFARFAGRRVEVRMRQPDAAGRRRFAGRLKEVAGDAAVIEVDGQAVSLKFEQMDRARLVPDL